MCLMYVLCPVLPYFNIEFFISVYKFLTGQYCALCNKRKDKTGHVDEEWKHLPHFFVVTPKLKQ